MEKSTHIMSDMYCKHIKDVMSCTYVYVYVRTQDYMKLLNGAWGKDVQHGH